MYDIHSLPPEEFVPRPPSGSEFDVIIAIGYDKAALVISAPETFMEWERDKEGSVCNPETFLDLPTTPGVYRCKLELTCSIESDVDDPLYWYSYKCLDAVKSLSL